MHRFVFAFLLILTSFSGSCFAQIYPIQHRPPNQDWQFLQTPHFKLIYANGNDSTAYQMGYILEEQYPKVQDLVGGELTNFPVILNDYNDRSNGFVSPIHFRSEIELPPIKGKSMNPQTGNWLENVGPHELVHALQFSNLGDYNIPQLVSVFSPDLARSFYGAIPSGVLEGIAVHHETEGVAPNGGRGNYPIFTNQFNSIFDSNQRWSIGQLVHTSTYSRPFDRHYIGGYAFTSWLQEEYGSETTREALDFYMDFPFLGYGVALHHATGNWPGQLYNEFEKSKQKILDNDQQPTTEPAKLTIPYNGANIRRPKWRSDSELIFYGAFYNARPGFYTYNLKTDNLNHFLTTNAVNDYRYDLSADRSEMIYSYYEADAIYDNTFKAELVRYNFDTRKRKQVTDDHRLYAPAFSGDGLLALQTKPASSKLVSVQENGDQSIKVTDILSLGDHEITAVAANPAGQEVAVVANKRGLQALWIADRENLKQQLTKKPDIAFNNGSVYDPEWHPQKQMLLFSSDFSGTHQLYEYDLSSEEVTRITGSSYNAFEGSYSPDGKRIAFIKQVKNERLPFVVKRANSVGNVIPEREWRVSDTEQTFMQRPVASDSIKKSAEDWRSGDYTQNPLWIKPRTILPVFEEVQNRNVYQYGLEFHSNNLLGNQSYSAQFSYVEKRLWYDISYYNKSFFPGFRTQIFSRPSYFTIPDLGVLLRQERSFALSVPSRVQLNQNIYNTSLFIEPELRQSQVRYFALSPDRPSSNFGNTTIGNLFAQFNFRLQQNIRDMQPNSGLVLFSELEHFWGSEEISLAAFGRNIRITPQSPTALRGGIFTYLSPLRKWNQSLRLGIRGLTQSGFVFNNQDLVSDAFSEPVLAGSNNLLSFSTRYTIPLIYPDEGGFLLPLYLSNVYLVAFTNTVTDPTFQDWHSGSRSVFGLGIRARFRLSNLSFNIGVGLGYEPTRTKSHFFIGDF